MCRRRLEQNPPGGILKQPANSEPRQSGRRQTALIRQILKLRTLRRR
jgi:hypothetical protein